MDDGKKRVVKKVSPYPITATMTLGGQSAPGQILKLTQLGFLIDLKASVVHVGQQLAVTFSLPALKLPVAANVKVIKTYDRYQPGAAAEAAASEAKTEGDAPTTAPPKLETGKAGTVQRIAEMHFLGLSEESRRAITKFLIAIKQVDGRL